jgi:putative ABC transport system permease protein
MKGKNLGLKQLLHTPLGFDAHGVMTMQISLPPVRYVRPSSRTHFFEALLGQISALPGVQTASGCTLLPFGYGENVTTFEIIGQPKQLLVPLADLNIVSTGYFQAMRIPLLRGRLFTREDRPGSLPVALINQTFGRRFFSGQDPQGQRLKMPSGDYTVAGVVGSVKVSGLNIDAPPMLYFPVAQSPVTDMTLAIRSRIPENTLAREVQRIVAGIDKDQPVYDISTLQERIDRSLNTRRFVVFLMLVFAAAGTGLAALGLYALLSYIVALRHHEIGIRIALGANHGAVAWLICRGGMALVAAGMALGSSAALGTCRLIAKEMYGVGIVSAVTWIAVLGIVGVSGFLATALPACRAARQSPAEVLRTE